MWEKPEEKKKMKDQAKQRRKSHEEKRPIDTDVPNFET